MKDHLDLNSLVNEIIDLPLEKQEECLSNLGQSSTHEEATKKAGFDIEKAERRLAL